MSISNSQANKLVIQDVLDNANAITSNANAISSNTNAITVGDEKIYMDIPYMKTTDPSYTITNASYPGLVPNSTLSHNIGTNTSHFSAQVGPSGTNPFQGEIYRFRIYKNSDTKIFDSKDNANFRTTYDGTQNHTESISFPSFNDRDFLYFDIDMALGADSDGHCALFYVDNSYQLLFQLYPVGNFSTTQTCCLFVSHDLVANHNQGLGAFVNTIPALGGSNFENYGHIKVGERKRFIIRLDYRTAAQITYQTKEHIISTDGIFF